MSILPNYAALRCDSFVKVLRVSLAKTHAITPRMAHSDPMVIEAGAAAFGDGTHESTRGVMEALARIDPAAFAPRNACDIGAGSGIISFAIAQKFGCPVLATDIAKSAVDTLKDNIANNLTAAITPIHADGFTHPEIAACAPFDLIVMNILPEPLVRLAGAANAHLAGGGVLILSGILLSKESIIIQVYQVFELELTTRIVIGDWVTLLWQKE
jgi:ribosomal protein L11 methyltransferase